MRAEPHYVDLLASRAAPSNRERSVPVASLESPAVADVPALVPLIESVKKHGVLQPLLVQERNGSLRVIAGRRRLAAAIAAGLREVPCIVHDVSDERAAALQAASNLDRGESAPAADPESTVATADSAGETLARALHTASSLADLLTGDISDMSRGVVGALLRAELFRATMLVQAGRVLRGELPVVRGAVPVGSLIDKVVQGFAAERRTRHVEFVPQVDLPPGHIVIADERLLAAALSGAAIATLALLDGMGSSRMAMVAGLTAARQLTLVVSQDHVLPPPVWIERAFDATWRERPGGAASTLAMTSLQRAARMHGGDATVTLSPRGSRVALTIPPGA